MNWVERVNAGLRKRDGAEREIAKALRERKKKVGTKTWLADCEREWGWSSSTAYRHLDPKQMAAARAHTCEQRKQAESVLPTVGTKKAQKPCEECGVTSNTWHAHKAGCSHETEKQKEARAFDKKLEIRRSRYAAEQEAIEKNRLAEEQARQSSNGRTPSDQDGNGGSTPALPLQIPARKDGEPDRRFLVDGKPQPNVAALLGDLDRDVARLEEAQPFLKSKHIEILSGVWDRLGAVIERYGHDGGEQETEALADDTQLVAS